MRAKKRLGQHFLHDPAVLRRLVGAVAPAPADRMVEIGPGRGALTRLLLERTRSARRGRDRPRARGKPARQRREFREAGRAHRRRARLRLRQASPRVRALYASSAIFRTTSRRRSCFICSSFATAIRDLHVMLQREVVERMTARPGGKDYGRLTVMLATAARCDALFDVGPGAFSPPPKVWSTVVRITPRAPEFAIADRARFASLVAHLFSMRRKDPRPLPEGARERRANRLARHRPDGPPRDARARRLRKARRSRRRTVTVVSVPPRSARDI